MHSEPHQANTMPLPSLLQSARIASTTAAMTGCQNFVCSWTTVPARTVLSSGGRSVQAAFRKSTPCASMAWNHSAGPTQSFSLRSLRNSCNVVSFGIPNLPIAAALMMQRIVTTVPKRVSSQLEMVLSKCAMPVADSSRGKGDCPSETTRQPAGGFGFSAWNVSSRTGTIRLLRDGPMKAAAFGWRSMIGARILCHVGPCPFPANNGARTRLSQPEEAGSTAGASAGADSGTSGAPLAFLSGGSDGPDTSPACSAAENSSAAALFGSGAWRAFLARGAPAVALPVAAFAFGASRFVAEALALPTTSATSEAVMQLPRSSTFPSTMRPHLPAMNHVMRAPALAFLAQSDALLLFCSVAAIPATLTHLHLDKFSSIFRVAPEASVTEASLP
mmetsp:Transcript_83258/g.235883  ORF Transcript_83258/g.235883 Transcript_83258/m.235883 type:complete len:389 (+) Transcript_83258:996-2162(+)